jgi:hypothetical protein
MVPIFVFLIVVVVVIFGLVALMWLGPSWSKLPCVYGRDPENGDRCKAFASKSCESGYCKYHCSKRCGCVPAGDQNHKLGVISGGKGRE